jgi:RNA polymerase sigma factor (sigma-70 family)
MSFDAYSRDLDRQKYKPLTNKELKGLWAAFLFSSDKKAWDRMWEHGLRLVLKIVNHMTEKNILRHIEREDAIQEGNLAIGSALLSWDPKKGPYSTWIWIKVRGAILDADRQEGVCGLTGGAVGDFLFEEYLDSAHAEEVTAEPPISLEEHIAKLPTNLRTYAYQVYILGLRPADIARADGVSRQRVDQVLSLARNRLKDCLDVSRLETIIEE